MRMETERLYLYPISNDEMSCLIEKEADAEMKQAYTEMLEGALWNLTTEYGMQSGTWNKKCSGNDCRRFLLQGSWKRWRSGNRIWIKERI